MSDEGEVMLSDVVYRHDTVKGNTLSGQRALGKWRALTWTTVRTLGRVSGVNLDGCRAGDITCMPRGVCRRVLKPRAAWEGSSGKAVAANPALGGRNPAVRDEKGGLRKRELW